MVAFDDRRGCSQVFDSGVGTRTDEDTIERHVFDRRAGFESHVFERAGGRFLFGRIAEFGWVGHVVGDAADLSWIGTPRYLRLDVFASIDFGDIVFRTSVRGQLRPTSDGGIEIFGRFGKPSQIVKGGLIGCDHARPRAGFDRHVADSHAFFHRQSADTLTGVLNDVSGTAGCSKLADQVQDHVFGGDAARQLAVDSQLHCLRLELQQSLCGQNVLDFAGPDPERQRSEGAVRGRVRIAANDRHAGLGVAVLGADDVNDSLANIVNVEQSDAELFAVLAECLNLFATDRIGDGQTAVAGGNIVIGRRDRSFGPADGALVDPQTLERLGAGHFVDQVQIDVDDGRPRFGGIDDVLFPDFVEHGPRGGRGGCGHVKTLRRSEEEMEETVDLPVTVNCLWRTVNG